MIKSKSVQKVISTIVVCSLLGACGGRTASPVMVSQYGDTVKSCEALQFELTNIQSEIQHLLPKTDKTGSNVALGVAGWFLLVPWFFMDFKNAEAQEYQAYRQRYNHLSSIALSKGCHVETIDLPSVDEIKKQHENVQ